MPKNRINSRNKGSAGEREFCAWLENTFKLSARPERNLDQVRNGGGDIIEPPFMFEVKRCEKISKLAWWNQVKKATFAYAEKNDVSLIPVVAFRQNNKEWEFLIPATEIGVPFGYVHITQQVFKTWARIKITGFYYNES